MEQSNVVMSRISERLYFYRVPCDYREAIKYFEDSFIQKYFVKVNIKNYEKIR